MKDIWGSSKNARLAAAKAIPEGDLKKINELLCLDCPITPWPFGNATSINPLLVTLGASPGGSPSDGDTGFLESGSHPFPTAGYPHPGTAYQDTKGYWDKMRGLASEFLTPDGGSLNDALALFGNVNLDTSCNGKAQQVIVDLAFANWVLKLISNGLRPRFLVLLGLSGYLQSNPEVNKLFEQTFQGFDSRRPHRKIRFSGYLEKNLIFREWDVFNNAGEELMIVMWPQHPSRVPFVSMDTWRASCTEFSERYVHLIE